MFNEKEYHKSYYLRNREKRLEEDKVRYFKNKDKILERRRYVRNNQSVEERNKRLAFHREYNKGYKLKNKELSQTDQYKFKQYAFAGRRRNYEFSLSLEDFKKIFHSNCSYCGQEDARGIDRVDNSVGYILQNVVSCCEKCNKMKWKWTRQEFIKQCIKISNFNLKS